MTGSQRKRDPPALGEDAVEERPHVLVFNTYTSSTPANCISQNTSRSYEAPCELDKEIPMANNRRGAKELLHDEVYHPRLVGASTAGNEGESYSTVEDEAASRKAQEIKMMEELKVVRHLTRPIQADLISMISERSRISKRKPRRRRGDSLERDISRTILQTADAGVTEAHFLVESSNTEGNGEEKGANFILSDLDQQNSDILAIDEVASQLPPLDHQAHMSAVTATDTTLEEFLEVDIFEVPKADPPEVLPDANPPVEECPNTFGVDGGIDKNETNDLPCDELSQKKEIDVIDDEEKESAVAGEEEEVGRDTAKNFEVDPPRKSNALQRRLAAAAESRRSGNHYPVTPSHENSNLCQLLHPDPSLQDITFSSTSASEEKQIEDFEFFEDNKFGNMDDYNDDQWTSFGDSPFSVSDSQTLNSSSFKMAPPRDLAAERTSGRRRSSVRPKRSVEKAHPVSPSRIVMQPRSPASVRDLRFNDDHGDSEFDISY